MGFERGVSIGYGIVAEGELGALGKILGLADHAIDEWYEDDYTRELAGRTFDKLEVVEIYDEGQEPLWCVFASGSYDSWFHLDLESIGAVFLDPKDINPEALRQLENFIEHYNLKLKDPRIGWRIFGRVI